MNLLSDERKQEMRRDRRIKSQVADMFTGGRQDQLMKAHSVHLLQGVDVQDIEERNRNWAQGITPEVYAGKAVLWIVGASHLAGLTIELGKLGWKARPFTPPT